MKRADIICPLKINRSRRYGAGRCREGGGHVKDTVLLPDLDAGVIRQSFGRPSLQNGGSSFYRHPCCFRSQPCTRHAWITGRHVFETIFQWYAFNGTYDYTRISFYLFTRPVSSVMGSGRTWSPGMWINQGRRVWQCLFEKSSAGPTDKLVPDNE